MIKKIEQPTEKKRNNFNDSLVPLDNDTVEMTRIEIIMRDKK